MTWFWLVVLVCTFNVAFVLGAKWAAEPQFRRGFFLGWDAAARAENTRLREALVAYQAAFRSWSRLSVGMALSQEACVQWGSIADSALAASSAPAPDSPTNITSGESAGELSWRIGGCDCCDRDGLAITTVLDSGGETADLCSQCLEALAAAQESPADGGEA